MLRRRLDKASDSAVLDPLACSSYEELRARSAILAYVVGEGQEDLAIFELAWKSSPSPGSAAVECVVRDLVDEGLLTIDAGRVVSSSAWISALVNP